MKGNLKVLVLLFSIILNAVFIGSYAAHKLALVSGAKQADNLKNPLYLQLDLSAEQLERFTAERDKFHGNLRELGQEIRSKQVELIDLLAIDSPDHQTIESKQREIHALQTEVQDRVIVHFLQESALLNPEQRTLFFQLIKERIAMSTPPCPPWARPLEKSQAEGNRQ
jgi:Spy/CpxP family protein refolding chaperone